MIMITEDYVFFETAMLLKEKGFVESCIGRYSIRTKDFHLDATRDCNNGGLFNVAAPTLQMAMKWLRDVHHIGVFPSTYTFSNVDGTEESHPYGTAIIDLKTHELMTEDIMPRDNYEDAVDVAIKYCLEKLI